MALEAVRDGREPDREGEGRAKGDFREILAGSVGWVMLVFPVNTSDDVYGNVTEMYERFVLPHLHG